MIAQELLSLVQQLSFVFRTGAEITPPQLLQDLVPCCLTHALIHFRHGNSHFWHNVSIPLSLPPSSGNKTFGAMRARAATSSVVEKGMRKMQLKGLGRNTA